MFELKEKNRFADFVCRALSAELCVSWLSSISSSGARDGCKRKNWGEREKKKRERKKTRDPRTTIDPIGLKVWGRSSRKSQATFTNRCQSFAKNIFLDRKESPPSSIGTLRLRLDRAWPCATDKTWTEVLAERFQTRHP